MISATRLTKAFGRQQILRGMTFVAEPGRITLLVGPNAAGKTTTIKLLAGLSNPDAGEAFIAGKSILRDRLGTQRLLSFLPQTPSFHPRFTCAQIVRFYARLRGADERRCRAVLEATGLREVSDEATGILSGGLRQRLGLALLLLPDAPVLILDEPGLSLDPQWRRRLQSILLDEADRGKTVLITTHLLAEWNGIAHCCHVCRGGVIEGQLDPANLSDGFRDGGEPLPPLDLRMKTRPPKQDAHANHLVPA